MYTQLSDRNRIMHSAHAREFTPGPSPGSGVVAGKGQSIDTMASAATHFLFALLGRK